MIEIIVRTLNLLNFPMFLVANLVRLLSI